jgi:hypothetical protein
MALWGSGGTHLPPWAALNSKRCSRESAAKLLRGRGRQLSSPDARRRREVAGGVVPLFSLDRLSPFFKQGCRSGILFFLDRLSPFFKRGCRSGIRWSQSKLYLHISSMNTSRKMHCINELPSFLNSLLHVPFVTSIVIIDADDMIRPLQP